MVYTLPKNITHYLLLCFLSSPIDWLIKQNQFREKQLLVYFHDLIQIPSFKNPTSLDIIVVNI